MHLIRPHSNSGSQAGIWSTDCLFTGVFCCGFVLDSRQWFLILKIPTGGRGIYWSARFSVSSLMHQMTGHIFRALFPALGLVEENIGTFVICLCWGTKPANLMVSLAWPQAHMLHQMEMTALILKDDCSWFMWFSNDGKNHSDAVLVLFFFSCQVCIFLGNLPHQGERLLPYSFSVLKPTKNILVNKC